MQNLVYYDQTLVSLDHETQLPTVQDKAICYGDGSLSHFSREASKYDLVSMFLSSRSYSFLEYRYTMWLLYHVYTGKVNITLIKDAQMARLGQDISAMLPHWLYLAQDFMQRGKQMFKLNFPRDISSRVKIPLEITRYPEPEQEETASETKPDLQNEKEQSAAEVAPLSYDPDCELLGGGGVKVYDKTITESVFIPIKKGYTNFQMKHNTCSPRETKNKKKYRYHTYGNFIIIVHGESIVVDYTFYDGVTTRKGQFTGREEVIAALTSDCVDISEMASDIYFDFYSASEAYVTIIYCVAFTNVLKEFHVSDQVMLQPTVKRQTSESVVTRSGKPSELLVTDVFEDKVNYKGMLNEHLMKMRLGPPSYEVVKDGQDHQSLFSATVRVRGYVAKSQLKSRTKILAEQSAAREMLRELGVPLRPIHEVYDELVNQLEEKFPTLVFVRDLYAKSLDVRLGTGRQVTFTVDLKDDVDLSSFMKGAVKYSYRSFVQELMRYTA